MLLYDETHKTSLKQHNIFLKVQITHFKTQIVVNVSLRWTHEHFMIMIASASICIKYKKKMFECDRKIIIDYRGLYK